MKLTLEKSEYEAVAARDDCRAERENGKCPAGEVRWPRFTYTIRGFKNEFGWTHYKRVVRDEVTGAERAFEMNEVNEMWAWKDAILEKKQAEQKQEAA